jgi:hypothetical protein
MKSNTQLTEHAGFHLASFSTNALDVIAIIDVDPARLTQLITLIKHSQST